MTRNANSKIEAIKSGKFGVEVEMYDITRERAAIVLGNFFNTVSTVRRGDTYSRWTVLDRQGRKWQFLSDSSIHDCHGGCELVTPVLGYEDMELLQEVIRELRKAGAKSDPNHDCGVHVHVDASAQTPKSLRTLTNLIASHEQLIKTAIRVDSQRDRWCAAVNSNFLSEINKKKPTTMDGVKTVWYESQGYTTRCANDHYNSSRYHLLNLHSLWQEKGIEFRCFQFSNPTTERKGGLHAGELKAYIQLCLAICEMAKASTGARHKVSNTQVENPKYAMKSFLNRLGFEGEEFKTARDLFTKDLEGTSTRRRATTATENTVATVA